MPGKLRALATVLVLTAQRFTLTETTLQGGRYGSIQGVTAAQLRYSLGEDEVSTLYEVGYDPGTFGPIPDLDQGQRPEQLLVRGLKVTLWVEKGLLMVLVAPAGYTLPEPWMKGQ